MIMPVDGCHRAPVRHSTANRMVAAPLWRARSRIQTPGGMAVSGEVSDTQVSAEAWVPPDCAGNTLPNRSLVTDWRTRRAASDVAPTVPAGAQLGRELGRPERPGACHDDTASAIGGTDNPTLE